MNRLMLTFAVGLLVFMSVSSALALGTVSLGDTVWVNTDGDSEKDAGEVGIPGATLTLSYLDGATWVALATTQTDAAGLYKFVGVTAGFDYKVSVTLPAGYADYTQNYDRDGVLDGQSNGVIAATDLTYDFGYIPPETTGGWETFTQGGWGAKPAGNNAGMLLHTYWAQVYGSAGLVVGGGYTLTFTSAQAVTNFLPSGGTAAALKKSYVDPVGKTTAGVLAGQVVAMRLNVDFSGAGLTATGLGSLKIQTGTYAGFTVAQLLSLGEAVLGGDTSGLLGSVADLSSACTAVNESFDNGADTGFLAK
ncbi:hypothetical protein LLH23_12800 [bacterium]|nr:hypothetical protein [bacterium]